MRIRLPRRPSASRRRSALSPWESTRWRLKGVYIWAWVEVFLCHGFACLLNKLESQTICPSGSSRLPPTFYTWWFPRVARQRKDDSIHTRQIEWEPLQRPCTTSWTGCKNYLTHITQIVVDKHVCVDWLQHFGLWPLSYRESTLYTCDDLNHSKNCQSELRQSNQKNWKLTTYGSAPQYPKVGTSLQTYQVPWGHNINIIFCFQRLKRFLWSRYNRDLRSTLSSTLTPSKNIGLLKKAWTISLAYIENSNELDFFTSTTPNFPVLKAFEIFHREVRILQTIVKTKDGRIKHPQTLYRNCRCDHYLVKIESNNRPPHRSKKRHQSEQTTGPHTHIYIYINKY